MDKTVVKLVHAGDANQLDRSLQGLGKDEKSKLLNTIYTHGDSIAHFAAREHQLEILKVLARHECPLKSRMKTVDDHFTKQLILSHASSFLFRTVKSM
ncbi:unnamed protein product [Umbelopsis ramanniana]